MARIRAAGFSVQDQNPLLSSGSRTSGPYGIVRVGVRQVEFPSTVEAHPVSPVFDREYTAEVAVATAKYVLENGL